MALQPNSRQKSIMVAVRQTTAILLLAKGEMTEERGGGGRATACWIRPSLPPTAEGVGPGPQRASRASRPAIWGEPPANRHGRTDGRRARAAAALLLSPGGQVYRLVSPPPSHGCLPPTACLLSPAPTVSLSRGRWAEGRREEEEDGFFPLLPKACDGEK